MRWGILLPRSRWGSRWWWRSRRRVSRARPTPTFQSKSAIRLELRLPRLMVAGTLSQSGYFMGDRPLKVTDANPKGYFEDAEINSINEDILDSVAPKRPPLLGRWFCLNRAQYSNRWVARIPLGVEIGASAS